ncbi:LLM class flavin-dependent oxidoreductase [Agromyces sp. SYSU K20354]|uniref:LLM class flavin-dependent oxidoreductase n=1 Tax=Agromyces cavernae TaxID=2898659 RepID=UPI001E5DD5EE|nr:LLM class flavin-dependent oxidoreductase [Agromyces cavernae]MCD2441261.1 LLM class flavin-dependent oxidoreductase [Agromyces cavernae]
MSAAASIGIIGTTPLEVVRALAPRIERLGFARLWINDVPGGDSLAGLRVAAEATSTLRLATGVIPLDRRPVDSLDLDGLPVDRLALGIGSGGVATRPVDFVGEGLARLRAVTDAPIVVGALGPRMRRLAAEQADGVLLNWLTPAAGAVTADELRRDAGERSVRSTLYVRTIVDESARSVLDREIVRYESVPAYAANFERLGFRAADATIADASTLAEYLDGDLDEIVLRAMTPSNSITELEEFVDGAARWLALKSRAAGDPIGTN